MTNEQIDTDIEEAEQVTAAEPKRWTEPFDDMIRRRRNSTEIVDWYAVRCAPGTQRMARAAEGIPENRIGESNIERSMRNEGIDVYMPAYWSEIHHHRNNKIIDRRFPLLVGYSFVHLPDMNFERVRQVEGVVCFLRGNFGPARFRVDDIAVVAHQEHVRRQELRQQKITRLEKETSNQIFNLRGQLRKIVKKGRSNKFNLKDQALLVINDMDVEGRDKILGILAELDSLEAFDGLASIDRVA